MSASPYGGKALRSGMAAYLAGRAVSAVLTLSAFALAARLLSLDQYGRYAAAMALVEMALALSTGGLEWVSARVLPECRLYAGGRATARMIWRLSGLQTLSIGAFGAAMFFAAPGLASLLRLDGAGAVFELAGLVLVAEGIGRVARDQMLAVLMEQRAAQFAQAVRSGVLVAQLAFVWWRGSGLDAHHMLQLELGAALCGAVLGNLLLWRVLRALAPLPGARPEWTPPPRAELARLALHNFSSFLLALLYGPQMVTMLIARILGAEAAAVYGFARAFGDQVRRYLPTDLLLSVLRPMLVAYFAAGNGFAAFSLRLGLWLKTSLVVLFPLLVFFAVFGELGMAALGGARYADAWPVMLVLLLGTATSAWRRVLELGCNTVMASDICMRATAVLVVVPLFIALSLHLTQQLLWAVCLPVMAELLFCWRVVRGLRRRGFLGAWEWQGALRLACGLVVVLALLLALRQVWHFNLPMAVLATALASLAAIRLVLPLNAQEGRLLHGWHARLARLIGHYGKAAP